MKISRRNLRRIILESIIDFDPSRRKTPIVPKGPDEPDAERELHPNYRKSLEDAVYELDDSEERLRDIVRRAMASSRAPERAGEMRSFDPSKRRRNLSQSPDRPAEVIDHPELERFREEDEETRELARILRRIYSSTNDGPTRADLDAIEAEEAAGMFDDELFDEEDESSLKELEDLLRSTERDSLAGLRRDYDYDPDEFAGFYDDDEDYDD